MPDTLTYKPAPKKSPLSKDSLKKIKQDTAAKQKELKSVSRKDKKEKSNSYLAAQTMYKKDE